MNPLKVDFSLTFKITFLTEWFHLYLIASSAFCTDSNSCFAASTQSPFAAVWNYIKKRH